MTTNWVGWVLSAIVVLLFFVVGAMLMNPVRLLITGERAYGVVVGMDTSSSPGAGALQSPMVEFVTSTGERITVSGRSYSASPSARVGDAVTVAYSPAQPRNAQLLLFREFPLGPAGFVLGFTGIVLLIWISIILISADTAFDDPLHLLPDFIAHFRLNPFRFPLLFLLSVVIPSCGLAAFVTAKHALDLRSNGIIVVGHVVGSTWESARVSTGRTTSGEFPMIAYNDASGAKYTIRGSLARPLSRLKIGDPVEVIYLARQPGRAILNRWYELYLVPLFLGSMMVAFLVLLRLVLSGRIRA